MIGSFRTPCGRITADLSLGNPVEEFSDWLSSPRSNEFTPHTSFLDRVDAVELLATEKLSGGGRVDRSGESARRAARRSLSLAVRAAAIIGSVSRGPANLENSCEFLFCFTFHSGTAEKETAQTSAQAQECI